MIQVVVSTGGTGFTGRDSTPEALTPLFDKTIDGFGELFRQISYRRNRRVDHSVALRRGTGQCDPDLCPARLFECGTDRLGEDPPGLSSTSNTRPCNFVELIPRLLER